jgi:hypothetical protein
MLITRVEAKIEKPIELVFGYVSNFETMPNYNSSVLSAKWIGTDLKSCKVKIGLSILNFESEYVLQESMSESFLRATCTTSNLSFEDVYEFSKEGDFTRLVITDSMNLKGILSLSEGILRPNMKREMEQNMLKLKSILDSLG